MATYPPRKRRPPAGAEADAIAHRGPVEACRVTGPADPSASTRPDPVMARVERHAAFSRQTPGKKTRPWRKPRPGPRQPAHRSASSMQRAISSGCGSRPSRSAGWFPAAQKYPLRSYDFPDRAGSPCDEAGQQRPQIPVACAATCLVSSCAGAIGEIPAAMLVNGFEIASHAQPVVTGEDHSGTVDMPTKSAPFTRAMGFTRRLEACPENHINIRAPANPGPARRALRAGRRSVIVGPRIGTKRASSPRRSAG